MNYENEHQDTEEYFAALESLRQLSAGTWNATPNLPLGSVADEIVQSELENREINEFNPEETIQNEPNDAFKDMEVLCLGSKRITSSSMLDKVIRFIN